MPTQNWPHLAGQKAAYTAKMLLDYQSRLRSENKGAALMHDIAVMMTPQQIAEQCKAFGPVLKEHVNAVSLKPAAEQFDMRMIPATPTWSNYPKVFDLMPFHLLLWNSIKIATISSLLIVAGLVTLVIGR